jgi:DNA-binding NarL/FixJ family response regulator
MVKNILLLDDDELFREGLSKLINSHPNFNVSESMNIKTFENKYKDEKFYLAENYDLIITSPPDPEAVALDFCNRFLAPNKIPLMILTNLCTKALVMKTIEIGGSAYYMKNISFDKLLDIMVEISSEVNYTDIRLHPDARDILSLDVEINTSFSPDELDVLTLVLEQKSSKEISEVLDISVRTVEYRKRAMMKKSHSKNMIGVVVQLLKSGHKI